MANVMLLDVASMENTYTDVETLSVPDGDGGIEKFVSERLILTQTQSDWSQTDDTAVDYIKNKPNIPSTEGLATEQFVKDEIKKIGEINIPSTEGLATEQFVKDEIAKIDIPSTEGLASEEYVQEEIGKINIPSTEGLASEQFVKDEISKINIPSTSGLATEEYVQEEIGKIDIPSTEGLASEEYVQEKISKINIPSIEGLASEEYVNDKAAEIAANQAQADFAEMDSSKPAFIKNKVVGYKEDFLPKTTWSFQNDSMFKHPVGPASPYLHEEGVDYIITWDGTDYPCTTTRFQYTLTVGNNTSSLTYMALGNPALFAYTAASLVCVSPTNDLPFLIGANNSYTKHAGEHTVRIRLADNIVKLDEKYLPDDIKLQPDWAQMDSTQKDFIKNKPTLSDVATSGSYNDLRNRPTLAPVATDGTYASLKEKLFGDTPVPLEEITMHFSPMEDFPDTYVTTHIGKELLLGESYIVKWDGTEYTCICRKEPGTNTPVLGNTTKIFWPTGEDTGEPFCVVWDSEKNLVGIQTDETDATHTISITPVNAVQKLDPKYLPDGLATEEFVTRKIAEIEIPEGGSGGSGGSVGITAADVTAMLASAGVIVPVAVEDNLLLTDSNNDIYIL